MVQVARRASSRHAIVAAAFHPLAGGAPRRGGYTSGAPRHERTAACRTSTGGRSALLHPPPAPHRGGYPRGPVIRYVSSIGDEVAQQLRDRPTLSGRQLGDPVP
jgi:hypothetical protein